jgi:hypothetical protein
MTSVTKAGPGAPIPAGLLSKLCSGEPIAPLSRRRLDTCEETWMQAPHPGFAEAAE